jgi:hypothetical protein
MLAKEREGTSQLLAAGNTLCSKELEVWNVEDLEVPIYLRFFRSATSRKPLFGGVRLDWVFFGLGGAACEAEYGIVSLKRYRAKHRSAVARLDVTNIGRSEGSISWIKTAMAR